MGPSQIQKHYLSNQVKASVLIGKGVVEIVYIGRFTAQRLDLRGNTAVSLTISFPHGSHITSHQIPQNGRKKTHHFFELLSFLEFEVP